MDAYCFTIIVFAFSLMGGMNMFVTVLKMRAPGMTWGRLPVFVWASLLSGLLGLVVFPTFTAAVTLTLLDRVFGTSFYQAAYGGNNFVYEQLFWFMGHPEVYVIAAGFRRRLRGGHGVHAQAAVRQARGRRHDRDLHAQHEGVDAPIYWSGANTSLDTPIMLDTELISIPTGLIFFALIGTLWRGRIRLEPPMLFAMGFIATS